MSIEFKNYIFSLRMETGVSDLWLLMRGSDGAVVTSCLGVSVLWLLIRGSDGAVVPSGFDDGLIGGIIVAGFAATDDRPVDVGRTGVCSAR